MAPPPRRPGILRSSIVFGALTLVSRLLGFARDLVVTAKLGASLTPAADAYNTMLAFPNLFRRIFAEGAFAAAFVPAYARKLRADGEVDADQLASDAMATLAAATIVLSAVCIVAMPLLMYVINPGYADDPVKFKLAILLTQISMGYLPCMAIGALLAGVLNARGRFIVSGAFPIVLNVVMLAAIWPTTDPIEGAKAASWAVLVSGLLQAGLLYWGARRAGATIHLAWPKLTPEIKTLVALAIPGTIAASATQINIFISMMLASLVDGARSWLSVADRLYQLPLGLIGVAIGVALLPRLSAALHEGDHDDAQATTDQAVVFALALTLPAAAALMAMPFFLIDGMFTRDLFTVVDARATAQALFHYGWGVPAFVLVRVLSPAFFARQDTRTPMRYALASVAINIVGGVALFWLVGFQGIAAATSIAAWINVILLALTLRRRGDYAPSARAWSKIVRVALASTVLGGLCWLADAYRPQLEGLLSAISQDHTKELAIVLVSGAGAALYPFLVIAFGGLTLGEIRAAMRRPAKVPATPVDMG